MEDNEKTGVDMLIDNLDVENSKQVENGGNKKQEDGVHMEVHTFVEETGNESDKNYLQNVVDPKSGVSGVEDQGGHGEISEEQISDRNVIEEEKNISENAMVEENGHNAETQQLPEPPSGNEIEANPKEEEKNTSENAIAEENGHDAQTQQLPEPPSGNEIEANPKEDGGFADHESNYKFAETNVAADHNEMSENKDDSGSNLITKNKDADQVGKVTPSTAVNCTSEKSKHDTINTEDLKMIEEAETGTPEDQAAFMKELEQFYREHAMDFKPPKFYGQTLNLLKLYRAVTRLGGYDRVTGIKLWRNVGESFHPPKTCTTVSWTFRIFYEKALLEYERHKVQNGELQLTPAVIPDRAALENEAISYQTPGSGPSGRARRDSAARAMQGWHAQRHYGYGEVDEPITKDKSLNNVQKRDKKGSFKHKRVSEVEHQYPAKAARVEQSKQLITTVVDVGPPADWVKINVRETKDCFEVYALVPGLLREEVRVQSDPAGRLVITGQPEQLDNPWGITAFKKVVSLPARIDPLHTSAIVSLHGRLYVRVPFERSNI